jgi:hypothetical protein
MQSISFKKDILQCKTTKHYLHYTVTCKKIAKKKPLEKYQVLSKYLHLFLLVLQRSRRKKKFIQNRKVHNTIKLFP